ncbi:DUF1120 domain-containing protein, partial [Aeromonas veronii]|uniref:DUF1120 domain-containing protein n=1 Tax=Aeromonas veronii TaxID=654 RepID=UPI003B9E9684
MAASSSAFAAGPSATLQVQGSVTQGVCVATLANGGIVELGDYKADSLPTSYNRNLSINVNITCSAPTKFNVYFTDNRPDSSSSDNISEVSGLGMVNYHSGLGFTNAGNKIGHYRYSMEFMNGSSNGVDNDLEALCHRASGVTNKNCDQNLMLGLNTPQSFMIAGGVLENALVKHVNFKYRPWVYLEHTALVGIADVENIEGSTTMTLEYL